MAYITWNYYEIWYRKRRFRILIPKNIFQLWIVYYPDADGMFEMDIDFFGNRKGLEALRNACAALSEKDNIIVYFPCKRNDHLSVYNYFFQNEFILKKSEFADMVFMKPNTIKVSDWKEIRKRIPGAKSREWGYDFQCEFGDMCKKGKYEYRREEPSVIYRFDTVFFNTQSFNYPDLACSIEKFLTPELEKNFYEDIRDGNNLRGETYLWLYRLRYDAHNWYDFETGIFFWNTDIYQEAVLGIKSIEKG